MEPNFSAMRNYGPINYANLAEDRFRDENAPYGGVNDPNMGGGGDGIMGVPWFYGSDDPFARGAQVEYDPSKWTPQELMAYFEAIKKLASGNPMDPSVQADEQPTSPSGEPTDTSAKPPASTDQTYPEGDADYPANDPAVKNSTKGGGLIDKIGGWLGGAGDYVGKITKPIGQIAGAIGDITDLFKTPPEGVDKQQATAQQEMIKGTILNFEKQALSGAISPGVALQGIRNALAMFRNSSEYDAAGMTVVMQIASNAISNIQNKQAYAMGAPPGESNNASYRNWTTPELGERTKNLSTQMLLGNDIGKDFSEASPLGQFVKPSGEKLTDFLAQSKNFVGSMMPTDTKYEPAADQIRQQFQDQRKKLLAQQNYGV